MRKRCVVLRRRDSSVNWSYLVAQCGLDLQELDADRVDERDIVAILEEEPFAVVLPLSLPSYASLRIAELVAQSRTRIRLILVSGTTAPSAVLDELFDCLLPRLADGLIDALKQPDWIHAFERRSVNLDTAIKSVLETASCFWLSGPNHPETFASLVDYQKGISKVSRHFSVMFLASDPTDLARLRLMKELSEIENELSKRSDYTFSLKFVLSSRPDELARRLLDERPHIVHFSGHGDVNGRLCFEDPTGRPWPADKMAIAQMFEPCRRYTKCVLLNSCFSSDQARLIGEHIEYAIGLTSAVSDQTAIAMAKGFYGALSVTGRVSSSLDAARANLRLSAGDAAELHCERPMRTFERLLGEDATRQVLLSRARDPFKHMQLARAFRARGELKTAAYHFRLAATLVGSDDGFSEAALRWEAEADAIDPPSE